MTLQSTQLSPADSKASIAVALLAFAVGGVALCHGEAGHAALVAVTCGFALVLARLRQEREAGDARLGLADELRRARELLSRSLHRQALGVSRDVAERAQSASLQCAALELVAWCELELGHPEGARNALSWLGGSDALDPYCAAAVEDACGHSLWALHLLDRAARKRPLSREATLFRIDLCARLRGIEAACWLTLQQLTRLRREDAERMLQVARAAQLDSRGTQALDQALAAARQPAA